MRTIKLICVGFFLLLLVGAVNQDKQKKFFSRLKAGQIVTVKEVSGKYELLINEKAQVGSKVTEIGDDYVVLEDPSGLVETRIHVTSIKSIARWQQPKE